MPRWWLLFCKLLGATAISVVQVYTFLGITAAFGIKLPAVGYITVLPALVISGLMLGSLGLLLSGLVRQLENFAGIMNFVIFPMFFLSTALYPLWQMAESSALLRDLCAANPFTHAVELIRFALNGEFNATELDWTLLAGVIFTTLALWGYNPSRTGLAHRG